MCEGAEKQNRTSASHSWWEKRCAGLKSQPGWMSPWSLASPPSQPPSLTSLPASPPSHFSPSQHSCSHPLPTLNFQTCLSSCPAASLPVLSLCSPLLPSYCRPLQRDSLCSAFPACFTHCLGHSWDSCNTCSFSLFLAPEPNWRVYWEIHHLMLDFPEPPNYQLHRGRHWHTSLSITIFVVPSEMPNT